MRRGIEYIDDGCFDVASGARLRLKWNSCSVDERRIACERAQGINRDGPHSRRLIRQGRGWPDSDGLDLGTPVRERCSKAPAKGVATS